MRNVLLTLFLLAFLTGGTSPRVDIPQSEKPAVDDLDIYRMQHRRNQLESTKKKQEIIETQYQIIELMK